MTPCRSFETPRENDLGLYCATNGSGLAIRALPNGCLYAIEHQGEHVRVLINQIHGSPLCGGIGRLYLRVEREGGATILEVVGPGAQAAFGAGAEGFSWEGAASGLRHRVTLRLHPDSNLWLWQVRVENAGPQPLACSATLVQDIGLGSRGFVMGNEAYASQYVDHHIARHPRCGPVVMSRQTLAQGRMHPWVAHGCLEGAAAFATDALQLLGPAFRDTGRVDPAAGLPSERLQHEVACPMIQSPDRRLESGEGAEWTFFGLYGPDHPEASGDADLAEVDRAVAAAAGMAPAVTAACAPVRSRLQDALPVAGEPLDAAALAAAYPDRELEERAKDGRLLSFFVPDGAQNRHVVLRGKEARLARRHGAILRTGQGMLLDETTMCATCFMHGVFASLLTIGNTSFHRLFSASRDPYNITRSGGLRILVETETGWRLLAVPSVFEMGLSDCRWIYRIGLRTVTVRAIASGEDPALLWQVAIEGPPCRLLVFGGLVLGEREFDHAGRVEIDAEARQISFRPDPASLWGQRYPEAVYHLVTSTPDEVEAIGGDELLYTDGVARGGGCIALRTRPTQALAFAVVGALADPEAAERLARTCARRPDAARHLATAAAYWQGVTRNLRLAGRGRGVAAVNALLPWLAHDAMIHLTVPHGLEQSGGAAWGTRDVCQGPVEFLLALRHDREVREILGIVFAQQSAAEGDWPQWFMLEPYAHIRDRHSHGDVIIWPLKALCDYIEATDDLGFLDEPVAWRGEDLAATEQRDPVSAHVAKLLATVRDRFIPGTSLIRYGEGDWNDSLQPADPQMRDWMVSSWTVALLFQQVNRYAAVLSRVGRTSEAGELQELAAAMRVDFNRHLMRDGTVAGYALFDVDGGAPELLLHPGDTRTGLRYSLLPMTRSIIGGLFTEAQARHHLDLIRAHLLFPDGVRLMDRPVIYRGGVERVFRRAESAAFFGREIGLMYIHAHLRYGEAMAVLGEAGALWDALLVASPVSVADCVATATPRQRNTYFSSSDAAFPDRYRASADWEDLREGRVAVDGGWRIYSSGPGLYVNLLLGHALGLRRHFGARRGAAVLPADLGPVTLEMDTDHGRESWEF